MQARGKNCLNFPQWGCSVNVCVPFERTGVEVENKETIVNQQIKFTNQMSTFGAEGMRNQKSYWFMH